MALLKDIALIDRALVFDGTWAIALGIGGTGLLVAALSLPAVEAAVATGCGAVLWGLRTRYGETILVQSTATFTAKDLKRFLTRS